MQSNKVTLRTLRRQAELTQVKLADLVGISPFTISRYERGSIMPSGAALQRLAEVLGVSASEIDLGDCAQHTKSSIAPTMVVGLQTAANIATAV